MAATSGPEREWIVFSDPTDDNHRWEVDVTFLASSWECIFGCGCQGVREEPTPDDVQGCCSYGAHFEDTEDRSRVVRAAKRLTDEEWQFAAEGRRRGIYATTGPSTWRTRRVQDACIFLNRPGFAAGPGCALHLHAMNNPDVHFSALKPDVCWQLPLRVDTRIEEDDDSEVSTLTEFGRDGWGEGGEDLAWWCTEEPEAFRGARPVYRSMEIELRAMVGDELFESIAAYLDSRFAHSDTVPVHHPAEVPVTISRTRP